MKLLRNLSENFSSDFPHQEKLVLKSDHILISIWAISEEKDQFLDGILWR